MNKFYAVIKDKEGKTISINEARFTKFEAPLDAVCFNESGLSEKFSYFDNCDIEVAGFEGKDPSEEGYTAEYYKSVLGAINRDTKDGVFRDGVAFLFEPLRNYELRDVFEKHCIVSYDYRKKEGYYSFKSTAYVWCDGFAKLIDVCEYISYDFVTNTLKFADEEQIEEFGLYPKIYRNAIDCAKDNNLKFVNF